MIDPEVSCIVGDVHEWEILRENLVKYPEEIYMTCKHCNKSKKYIESYYASKKKMKKVNI